MLFKTPGITHTVCVCVRQNPKGGQIVVYMLKNDIYIYVHNTYCYTYIYMYTKSNTQYNKQ